MTALHDTPEECLSMTLRNLYKTSLGLAIEPQGTFHVYFLLAYNS